MNCRPSLELCPSPLLRLQFRMFRTFWRKLRLRCAPSHALLPFSLYLILRPVCLMNFCCALSEYVARTSRFVNRPQRLLCRLVVLLVLCRKMVSLSCSKDIAAPRAHSIRGIATSSAFLKNWSLSSVLEAASWRSNMVFTSFYLKDVQYIFEGVCSLGPFVAAGERLA